MSVLVVNLYRASLQTSLMNYTGWHRINRTIQPCTRVYVNLYKITPLTILAHRQIRRQKEVCIKYAAVINILCDVIADVVDAKCKCVR